jgi:CheY-like chemotaxis protein
MSKKRLLAVDDNKPFLEFVRKVAVELGYDVEVATSGAAFKKLFEDFQPHSVVVDLIMPDIDGMEIIQWLANQETPSRSIQVIVVTGYSPEYANLAMMLGEGKGLTAVKTLHQTDQGQGPARCFVGRSGRHSEGQLTRARYRRPHDGLQLP